jgi:Ca2+-binding EF-hand superfamily protein
LDEALKNVRVSPSLVFKEADTDGDGVIHLQELDKILKRLGITIDPQTLDRTFKEIDINGNGQIEQ